MDLAGIEQLIKDKADQRTEEVFGLFFVLFQKQNGDKAPAKGHELTLDGISIQSLVSISIIFKTSLIVELSYSCIEKGEYVTKSREFKESCVYRRGEEYSDVWFDKNNYIRLRS